MAPAGACRRALAPRRRCRTWKAAAFWMLATRGATAFLEACLRLARGAATGTKAATAQAAMAASWGEVGAGERRGGEGEPGSAVGFEAAWNRESVISSKIHTNSRF